MARQKKMTRQEKKEQRRLAAEAEKTREREEIYSKWGRTSKEGLWAYVLKRQIIGWALPMLVVYIIVMYLFSKISVVYFDGLTVIIAIIVFSIVAMFKGIFIFNKKEKIYREKFPYKNRKRKKK